MKGVQFLKKISMSIFYAIYFSFSPFETVKKILKHTFEKRLKRIYHMNVKTKKSYSVGKRIPWQIQCTKHHHLRLNPPSSPPPCKIKLQKNVQERGWNYVLSASGAWSRTKVAFWNSLIEGLTNPQSNNYMIEKIAGSREEIDRDIFLIEKGT